MPFSKPFNFSPPSAAREHGPTESRLEGRQVEMITPAMFSRFIVWLLLLAGLSPAHADEFDTLRLKWRDAIVGKDYDTTDPDVTARLTSIGNPANGLWSAWISRSFARIYGVTSPAPRIRSMSPPITTG